MIEQIVDFYGTYLSNSSHQLQADQHSTTKKRLKKKKRSN